MEEKVTKLLIKWGWNEEAAKNITNENISIAMRTYPNATPAFLAKICTY